jgi:hypothetical protein
MKDEDPIYKCFFEALTHETKTNWYRQQSALSLEADISTSYLTDILKGRTKASYPIRDALSKACGYSYQEFLQLGQDLLDGNDPSKKKPKTIQKEKKPGLMPTPIDPVVQLLQEALEETGVKINKKQKEAVIKILREELEKSEAETKEGIKKYLKAFSG